MNYDSIEMRRIGVDPSKWNWFNKDYSGYQVMDPTPVSYELKRVRRVKPGRFILSLALFIALVIFDSSTGSHPNIPESFVVISVMVFIAAMCFSKRKLVKVIGLTFGSVVPVSAMALIVSGKFSLGAVLLVFVAATFGVARLFTTSLYFDGKMVQSANRLNGAELWSNPERRVYGNPGKVASAVKKFGQDNVDAGVEGEIRTANILSLLLKIPGVTVFHGLQFPGSRNSDVDHAVVHGSNVYLIDSKQWKWGTYDWQTKPKYGEQIATARGFGRKNHMDAAAAGYRAKLGPYVNVIPIVIMHGANVKIGENRWSSAGVGLFTPDEAMRFMGETISHDMLSWNDNIVVRGDMLRNLKA